ncbi:MAG: DUF938 domain-containing protein [Thiolinea sp.]
MKPYSESCVQNRDAILSVIQPLLAERKAVLEIGSGTGQHAVYFGAAMPHLNWHTSDQAVYHEGIRLWLEEAQLSNVHMPLTLDVQQANWPPLNVDAVFTANTFHIMSEAMVADCIAGVGKLLATGGLFIVYGPFNYQGEYTSASNASFDQWLVMQNPESAIRDFEKVNRLAEEAGMALQEDYAMPANNRILCWCKV